MSHFEVGTLDLVYARERMERWGYKSYPKFCEMIKRERLPHVKLGKRLYLDDNRLEEELRLRMNRKSRRRRAA